MNKKWKLFLSILLTMALSRVGEMGLLRRPVGDDDAVVEDEPVIVDDDDANVDDAVDDDDANVDDDDVDTGAPKDGDSLMPDDGDEDQEATANVEVEATGNETATANETAALHANNVLGDLKNLDTKTLLGVTKKPNKNETNEWSNHCMGDGVLQDWSKYPCRLGWRHGCNEGICWSQCNAVMRLSAAAEWCYVKESKPVNETGTGDDSDWKYISCKTDADCTNQLAYRHKCKGACSMGKKERLS